MTCKGKSNSGINLWVIKNDQIGDIKTHLLHKGDSIKDLIVDESHSNKYTLVGLVAKS